MFPACVRAQSPQSCSTLCDAMDCSPPGSSIHGILQARTMEWVAMPSCRGASRCRGHTSGVSCVFRIAGGLFITELPEKPHLELTSSQKTSDTHFSIDGLMIFSTSCVICSLMFYPNCLFNFHKCYKNCDCICITYSNVQYITPHDKCSTNINQMKIFHYSVVLIVKL